MKKAAVIGAGIGGLALAIRLQSAGVDTSILEARD
jgi:phytoene desaturase